MNKNDFEQATCPLFLFFFHPPEESAERTPAAETAEIYCASHNREPPWFAYAHSAVLIYLDLR